MQQWRHLWHSSCYQPLSEHVSISSVFPLAPSSSDISTHKLATPCSKQLVISQLVQQRWSSTIDQIPRDGSLATSQRKNWRLHYEVEIYPGTHLHRHINQICLTAPNCDQPRDTAGANRAERATVTRHCGALAGGVDGVARWKRVEFRIRCWRVCHRTPIPTEGSETSDSNELVTFCPLPCDIIYNFFSVYLCLYC